MVFWTPYPWYIEPPTYDSLTSLFMVLWPPYPWYFVPLHMVCRSPYYGMLTPLYMVYCTPYPLYLTSYPWYFNPPTHGILNPLPMVFWPPIHSILTPPSTHCILTPYPWYFEGVNLPWGVQNTMMEYRPRGQYIMKIDPRVKIPYDTGPPTQDQ